MADIEIVSGGQTGVDRAALDTAMAWGLRVGGWCPAGRRAEDGPIDAQYPLEETPQRTYLQRTQWNVRDSDGTLILQGASRSPGTDATAFAAQQYAKPVICVRIDQPDSVDAVVRWMEEYGIVRLNVAGPRESELPGAYDGACACMAALFRNKLLRLEARSSQREK